MYEVKIYRGVMCHGNEEWYKIWRGIDLTVQNWHEEFQEFWPKHSKISKTRSFGLLLTKVYNVWAKKVERSYVMALNIDAKFEGKLTCPFKNDMKNLVNFRSQVEK